MLRIHFTAEDLARVRIADVGSPAVETLFALHRCGQVRNDAVFEPWRRTVARRMGARLAPLVAAARATVPDTDIVGLDGPARLGAVIAGAANRATAESVTESVAAVRQFHQVGLVPFWRRIRLHLRADREWRAGVLLGFGVEGLLGTLHRQVRWQWPTLELDDDLTGRCGDIHLGGRGLVVASSLFLTPAPAAIRSGRNGMTPVLVYPVPLDHRSAAALWRPGSAGDTALGAVVGRTRADILRSLQNSSTTKELGRRLGLSAATISQHTAALREAGLIATGRRRNTVLHTLTQLGAALVDRDPSLAGRACHRD